MDVQQYRAFAEKVEADLRGLREQCDALVRAGRPDDARRIREALVLLEVAVEQLHASGKTSTKH